MEAARILFSAFLIIGVPLLSAKGPRIHDLREIPKESLYASAVASQWILAGIGAAVVLFAWPDQSGVGLNSLPSLLFVGWTGGLVLISLAGIGIVLLLEKHGLWPDEPEMVRLLMPQNARERRWALLGLAPTAGICEEFLYRGFLLTEVARWCNSAAWGAAISSVAFGLAHTYQGRNGMVRAALLGGLLAWPVVRLNSLFPSMAAHFLIDAVALLWLGPKYLKQTEH